MAVGLEELAGGEQAAARAETAVGDFQIDAAQEVGQWDPELRLHIIEDSFCRRRSQRRSIRRRRNVNLNLPRSRMDRIIDRRAGLDRVDQLRQGAGRRCNAEPKFPGRQATDALVEATRLRVLPPERISRSLTQAFEEGVIANHPRISR